MSIAKPALKFTLLIIATLFVAEVILRIAFSSWRITNAIRSPDGGTSQRLFWLQQNSGKQKFIYNFDVHNPTLGWSVAPNIRNKAVFENRILNSNSKGIRGTKEYSKDKPANTKRIMIFGDSYTFGDEVSDNETYSYQLDQLLKNTEVMNMGIHAFGHDQMLIYLNETIENYQPDIVILGYVWFDKDRNMTNFSNYSKPYYKLDHDKLVLRNKIIPSPEQLLANQWKQSRILDLFSMLTGRLERLGKRHKIKTDQLAEKILSTFASKVIQTGAVPLFVYLPTLNEMTDSTPGFTDEEKFLKSVCDKNNIRCIFPRSNFLKAAAKGVKFNTKGHWYAPGHQVIAQSIARYLKEKQLLH